MINEVSSKFLKIEPGDTVAHGGRKYRITHLISVDSVLAEHLETQQSERLRIEQITEWVEPSEDARDVPVKPDVAQFSESEWSEAQRRMQAIKPLLEVRARTRSEVERIAKAFGASAETLYRWLKLYQESGHVSSLVPAKRGRRTGVRLLTAVQECIIETAIEETYLTKQKRKPNDVVEEVKQRCRLAKVEPPHPNTIRNRISELDPAMKLRRRGLKDEARNRYAPIRGHFPGADHNLSVAQIDHTEADVILVDEVHRLPIARPWLTLIIDVLTRMILGIYLTFEKPSSTSVAMCLANAICPKREYLAGIGVAGEWPVWGTPKKILSDNAKEFRGGVLQRACEEYAIDLEWRPVQLPHYGGHIERLMGTMLAPIES